MKEITQAKICVINVYFGKLPNYFSLWLKSCEYNKTIDFLFFTDDRTEYNYPSNVKVIYTTFKDIKMQIQKYFEFEISLEYTYKLCDYKPAYGYVFQDYLEEYDFWGHCDLDVIFGDLRKYLSEEILEKNDKIYPRGHFTLYKNEKRINENFKELIDEESKEPLYKKIYSSNSSYYFDEWTGIIKLYDDIKYKMYNKEVIADISIKYNNLLVSSDKKNKKYIFKWCIYQGKSKIYGLYKYKNKIEKQEFMYIHLQKRKMELQINEYKNQFYIVPNKFININKEIDKDVFEAYNNKLTMIRKEYLNIKLKRAYKKIFRKGKKE